MEIKKSDVTEKAAEIIIRSGIEYLSRPNLAKALGVDKRKLNNQFTHDDDILVLLLLNFESEFKKITDDFSTQQFDPELELKLLFKEIYSLFMKKPYYLSIIFDKNLIKRENNVKLAIIRIKNSVSKYLTTLINAGKIQHTFQSKVPTRLIVGKLLTDFRLLMKDEQRVNEMILELKTIKTFKD